MFVSDNVRHMVAEKLRNRYYERLGRFEPQDMGIQAANLIDDINSCMPAKGKYLLLDLADMIDPIVNMEALFELAHEMTEDIDNDIYGQDNTMRYRRILLSAIGKGRG